MKQRSPIAVFFLAIITLGIYSWYWLVKTKGEMNKLGEQIPTAWIWLIPFVGSIWWLWKYSEGVEHMTNEKLSWVLSFVLLFLLGNIGQAIIQDFFNKTVAAEALSSTPIQSMVNQPVKQPAAYGPVAETPPEVTPEPIESPALTEAPVDDQSSL